MNETKTLEPVVDTGKWKADMSARLEALMRLQEKTEAQVRRVADQYDKEHAAPKFDFKAWAQKCLAYALGLLKSE